MKTIESTSTTTWCLITEEIPGRSATIYITDGAFTHCVYSMGHCGYYSRDDWHFLGLVAARIGDLGEK